MQRMLVEHACAGLVHRAATLTDRPAPDEFAALFTMNAELVRPNGDAVIGRPEIEASYRARSADRLTRHLITTVVVDVESSTSARGKSVALLWSGSLNDSAGPFGRPAHARQVVGEFEDQFELTAEGWRIARRQAQFLLFTPPVA